LDMSTGTIILYKEIKIYFIYSEILEIHDAHSLR